MFTKHTTLAHSLYTDQAPHRPDRDYTTQRDTIVAPQRTHTAHHHSTCLACLLKSRNLHQASLFATKTQTTISSSAPLTIQNHKSVGSPRLLSTHMLDSSHELKEAIVFSVWIMVPYNSENQDCFAHYNNEQICCLALK